MRFGEKAFQYDSRANEQIRVARWLSEWLETDVSGMKGLEFGSGTGIFTSHLVKQGFVDLVASDQSERMLEIGMSAVPQANWLRVDAWQAPELPLVDRIYSSSLLQWARDPVSVFKRWKSCLKPKGKMLLSIFIEGSLREFQDIDPGFSALQWRNEDEWMDQLKAVGFRIERYDTMENQLHFRSSKEALHSLHDIGAVREKRMTIGSLRNLLRECDRRCGPRGYVPLTWNSLKVECSV
jgi:SAM-dependent methyltransferase